MKSEFQKSKVGKLLCWAPEVEQKLIDELWNAGLGPMKISKLVGKTYSEIVKQKGENNPNALDDKLVDKILYDADYPVTADVIISNEKERYAVYSKLEADCLKVMSSLIEYYSSLPIGVDAKQDAFVARLVKDFISVTHSARQELIAKYAIDKKADKEDKLQIEFIEGTVNDSPNS